MGPRTRNPRAVPSSAASEAGSRLASAEESAWNHSYYQLHQFHRERGHCEVPGHEQAWRKLAAWAAQQRDFHQRGKLPQERHAKLDALGFTWVVERARFGRAEVDDAKWHRRYAELIAFKRQHGHTRVTKLPPGNPVLWHWRHVQREWRRKGILKPERIAQLDAIGFEWEETDRFAGSQHEKWESRWAHMFEQLVQFKQRFGHCRVADQWAENPALGKWVNRQRLARKHGELRPPRMARLEALGFAWKVGASGPLIELWERRFGELLAFKNLTGHTRVSKDPPGNPVLWHWRHVQREFRRKGTLSAERIARLDAVGFEWVEPPRFARSLDPRLDDRWERRFQQLAEYQERCGHCRVSKGDPANRGLAQWVNRLRVAHRKGELRPDRQARVEALGFDWSIKGAGPRAERWQQRFSELQGFLQTHGHTRVPKGDKVLWNWRVLQRVLRRKGALSAERIARLDSLGFEWDSRPPDLSEREHQDARWNLHCEQLRAFQQRFGHSRVPRVWAEYPHLPQWLRMQRRAGRDGKLLPQRRARLDSLDLPWQVAPAASRVEVRGERRLAELAAFGARFGHTRVPVHWSENPGLGTWLACQRHLHRRGRLSAARVAQLEALGCAWDPQPSSRASGTVRGERRLAQLAAFRARFGHTRVPVQWQDDPGLGEWTSGQRVLHRKGRLAPERVAQLEALGFEWQRQPRPRIAAATLR